MESPRWRSCLCLNLSVLCQILSAGFAKKAALTISLVSPPEVLGNGYYLLALFFLGMQSIFWPIALQRYPLTIAYLYMSISYPAILVVSWLVFCEPITLFNGVGTVMLVAGVNLVMGGGNARKLV